MLWAAGEKRANRETRERMTEMFVASRDGYLAAHLGSKMEPPAYTRPDGGRRAQKGIADLIADFPGAVSTRSEFRH